MTELQLLNANLTLAKRDLLAARVAVVHDDSELIHEALKRCLDDVFECQKAIIDYLYKTK